MAENIIKEKADNFAVRVVKAYNFSQHRNMKRECLTSFIVVVLLFRQ